MVRAAPAAAPCGRCTTSQGTRSCSPDTPMTKGRIAAPLDTLDQPYAVWIRTDGFAHGADRGAFLPLGTPTFPRDTVRRLDTRHGFRSLNHNEGSLQRPPTSD